MQIFSFIFTKPDCDLVSARVAAKNKMQACLVVQLVANVPLIAPTPGTRADVGEGIICQYAGEDDRQSCAKVVSFVMRDRVQS